MAASKLALLELRLATLESEVAQLREQTDLNGASSGDWVDQIYGLFADYPDFNEVVRLGRQYRESLRQGATKKNIEKNHP
ncbi:MAG: hypothetical protein M3X11_04905 [Acidobacteriota bacterium]|nr:hypothetical protein [Acidobacteriota bacterium]